MCPAGADADASERSKRLESVLKADSTASLQKNSGNLTESRSVGLENLNLIETEQSLRLTESAGFGLLAMYRERAAGI